MRKISAVLITVTVLLCPAAAAQVNRPQWPYADKVKDASYTAPDGERVLRHETVIPAPVEEVWHAFTTAEGLASWMAPAAQVELKTGGKFESNYRIGSKLTDPDTIHNMLLSYVPQRMFSAKVNLVDGFPQRPREAGTLFVVVEFEPVGAKQTKVTASMLGWGAGDDWNKVYDHFQWGNGYTMGELYRRFKDGPVDWAAVKARQDAASKQKSTGALKTKEQQ